MCVLRGEQGLWVHDQAIADLNLGGLGLRRTASPRPLLRDTDRFDLIVQHLGTPRPGLTPTPPLPTPFVLCNSGLGGGGTGKPAGCHALDVRGDTRGLLGLGGGIRRGRLLG
jgi:hypothetical protein